MIFNLSNPYEVSKYDAYTNNLRMKRCIVEVKEKKNQRSLRQNSYLHVIISYFACEYGCSLEEAKLEYYKKTCNKDIYVRRTTNKYGMEVERCRSSRELDTSEMTTSIERFRNWSVSVAGIYLPSPQEHEYIIHCMQVIEENKEYIEQLEN